MISNVMLASLRAAVRLRGYSQSQLARRVGCSRQAVSLWFKNQNWANVHASTLRAVSDSLGVPVKDLLEELPGLAGEDRQSMETEFLWDNLYPNLEHFLVAASRGVLPAVARMVEARGMFAAAAILGPTVWTRYNAYARYLPPAKRRVCSALVDFRQSLREERCSPTQH